MRILVIEDDRETSTYIANGLVEEGHAVDCFADGRDGLLQATAEDYDVLIYASTCSRASSGCSKC